MAHLTHEDYTIGWICALDVELAASMAVMDEENPPLPQHSADSNSYTLCRIGKHNVVFATLPSGQMGNNSAASVAARMTLTFPAIRFGIMVGIGGGVPSIDENGKVVVDIRLGDVVVSNPGSHGGGVIQYDFGKTVAEGKFIHTGTLNHPPKLVLTALQTIKARHRLRRVGFLEHLAQIPSKLGTKFAYVGAEHDQLFLEKYEHPTEDQNCNKCDRNKLVIRETRETTNPVVHYGVIASGNGTMRHAETRERLRREYEIKCFEMEAAGLTNELPCVVIRGISDYSDSHRYRDWKPYAAATAAAYAKELLSVVPVGHAFSVASTRVPPVRSSLSPTSDLQTPASSPSTSSAALSGDLSPTDNSNFLVHPKPGHSLRFSSIGNNLIQLLTSAFTIVTDSFLPWNRAALGRLVLHIDDPGQDYCPHVPFDISPNEISTKYLSGISAAFDIEGDSGIVQRFKRILSRVWHNEQTETSIYTLMARGAVTYQLLNSGDFFERLVQDENTRRWIEKCKHEKAKDVYLIVGIHALLNFEINVGLRSDQPAENLEPISSTDISNNKSLKVGDRIIGVQYRRVRVQGWNSNSPGLSIGKKSWWKKYYRTDQFRTPDNLEVDILTAELDETATVSDIRDDIPPGCEIDVCRSNVSGEDFVFLTMPSQETEK